LQHAQKQFFQLASNQYKCQTLFLTAKSGKPVPTNHAQTFLQQHFEQMKELFSMLDSKTKKIVGKPQVTSRGFIFVKENFDLVNATKKKVEEVVYKKTSPGQAVNWDYVKNGRWSHLSFHKKIL